jgi:Gas vesicle protein G
VNFLTLLFRLPLMPLRGFIQLAEVLAEEAEREYYSPSAARHELEEAEQARVSGEMSDADVSKMEYNALGRMMRDPGKAPADAGGAGEEG